MATSYPSQYKWFVLAYYQSGAARTYYKGDIAAEAKAALQKARAAKNIDTVQVFNNGRKLGN